MPKLEQINVAFMPFIPCSFMIFMWEKTHVHFSFIKKRAQINCTGEFWVAINIWTNWNTFIWSAYHEIQIYLKKNEQLVRKKTPLKFRFAEFIFFIFKLCVFNFPIHCVSHQQLIFNQDKLPYQLSAGRQAYGNVFFLLIYDAVCKHAIVSVPVRSRSLIQLIILIKTKLSKALEILCPNFL